MSDLQETFDYCFYTFLCSFVIYFCNLIEFQDLYKYITKRLGDTFRGNENKIPLFSGGWGLCQNLKKKKTDFVKFQGGHGKIDWNFRGSI